jgi:hypothetical protein
MTHENASSQFPYPDWQPEYRAAVVELDRQQLPTRVAEAESAINKRLQAISQGSDHHAEHQAIQDALATLRMLKRREV